MTENATAMPLIGKAQKTGKRNSGTVNAAATVEMKTGASISQSSIDGVSTLLNNVSSIQDGHQQGKEYFFSQNLPFYTCINAYENIWQKEMPDGTVTLVHRTYNWDNDQCVEKLLKK